MVNSKNHGFERGKSSFCSFSSSALLCGLKSGARCCSQRKPFAGSAVGAELRCRGRRCHREGCTAGQCPARRALPTPSAFGCRRLGSPRPFPGERSHGLRWVRCFRAISRTGDFPAAFLSLRTRTWHFCVSTASSAGCF